MGLRQLGKTFRGKPFARDILSPSLMVIMSNWSDNRIDAYWADSQYSQGDRLQVAIECTRCHEYKCFDKQPEYIIQKDSLFVRDRFCNNIYRRRFHYFKPVD